MAIAGHLASVSLATGVSVAAVELCGIKNFSIGDSSEMLDVTAFCDSRLRKRIVGLRDLTLSIDGDVKASSAVYQLLRANYIAGTPVHVEILHDGTNGVRAEFVIGSLERSAGVDGLVEVSVSMEHSGDYAPIDIGTGF